MALCARLLCQTSPRGRLHRILSQTTKVISLHFLSRVPSSILMYIGLLWTSWFDIDLTSNLSWDHITTGIANRRVFMIFIILFQLHLHHQCGPQPCRSGLRGGIPQKESIYEINFPRAAVVGSSDTTAKWQRQRLDGCSCIPDVSPTITRASMWRKAQDTSWSLLLTPENTLTLLSRAFLAQLVCHEYSCKNTRMDQSHKFRKST